MRWISPHLLLDASERAAVEGSGAAGAPPPKSRAESLRPRRAAMPAAAACREGDAAASLALPGTKGAARIVAARLDAAGA